MDREKTHKIKDTNTMLISNEHYFKNIFKKTEKIVCAILYVLKDIKDKNGQYERTARAIEDISHKTLSSVLQTLSAEEYAVENNMVAVLSQLTALQSYIEVGRAVGVIRHELADVLSFEIEGVNRSVRQYIQPQNPDILDFSHTKGSSSGFTRRTDSPARSPVTQRATAEVATNRRERIKEILVLKGRSSIKDISEDIKDCSEKTIQRELNTMIKDGIIKKEGEKRWSTYSVI